MRENIGGKPQEWVERFWQIVSGVFGTFSEVSNTNWKKLGVCLVGCLKTKLSFAWLLANPPKYKTFLYLGRNVKILFYIWGGVYLGWKIKFLWPKKVYENLPHFDKFHHFGQNSSRYLFCFRTLTLITRKWWNCCCFPSRAADTAPRRGVSYMGEISRPQRRFIF